MSDSDDTDQEAAEEPAQSVEVESILIPTNETESPDGDDDDGKVTHMEETNDNKDRIDVDQDEPEPEIIYPIIKHPDTSLIDITQIHEEIEEGSYYGIFGKGLYAFPKLVDPGLDNAFNLKDVAPPSMEAGVDRYKYVCKALSVIPVGRFIKDLYGTEAILRFYGLDPVGVRGIAEALFCNTTVKALDLEDNWLTRDAVFHLSEMLRENKTLVHLNLTGCRIGASGASRLREGLSVTSSLLELNLSWNDLGDEGMEELAPGIATNYSLRRLNLSHNKLGTAAGITLKAVMEDNYSLEHLDLSWNGLYPKEGLKPMLTGMFHHAALTSLNLAWNGISGKSAGFPIKNLLKNNELLEHLDLSNNRLEGLAVRIIKAGMMASVSLLSMNLGFNPILPATATVVLRVLANPESKLQTLLLEDVWVDKEFKQLLATVRKTRDCEVKVGGVYSDYPIVGPDPKKLLLQRARFEAQKPKSKKKKKDFGHFILKLTKPGERPQLPKSKFLDKVKEAKIKLDENLVLEIMKNFVGEKKRVDLEGIRDYYMTLYPDTQLPEVKKKKKGKGKKKAKKDK